MKKLFAIAALVLGTALGAFAQSSSVTGNMPDNGPSLPSTCSIGYIYAKTSAAGGAVGLYFCNPANTLTAFPFTSNPFSSGGVTINKIPKSDGAGALADSSCTDNATTVTCTEPVVLPAGSGPATANTAIQLAAGGGLYGTGSSFRWASGGSDRDQIGNAGVFIIGNATGFCSGSTFGTEDWCLMRRGGGITRIGLADVNGAPVAQSITVQNAITGTDLPGADFTINGSIGTGAGVPKAVNINGGNVLGTGTTAQSNVLSVGNRWFKALTNNTTTTVSNVAVASNTASAIIVHYGIEVFDGTNLQWETGLAMCGVVNKAGAFAQNTCTKSGNAQGLGSGTLTVTWTLTGANPALLQINSNSSLTTTTNRLYYNIENLTNQAVTEQ